MTPDGRNGNYPPVSGPRVGFLLGGVRIPSFHACLGIGIVIIWCPEAAGV